MGSRVRQAVLPLLSDGQRDIAVTYHEFVILFHQIRHKEHQVSDALQGVKL